MSADSPAAVIVDAGGVNIATVKAASTAVIAADQALVVAVSPNNVPLLPAGAATEATLATRATEATLATRASEATLATRVADSTITARLNTLGQKPMATSTPVVIASDQSAVPISAVSLPLPSGAATEATLSTRAAASQLPALLVGGRLDENVGAWLGSTAPTVGQKTMSASLPVALASDQSALPITDNGGSLTVDTPQLPAALVGGRLDENVGSWLGSVAPTVGQKTGSNSLPVIIASDQSTLTVEGLLANNNAAPASNNVGVLPARATAAAPSYTEGNQALLSTDLAGALRVAGTISATNASIGSNAAVAPTSSTQVGGSDGTNLQAVRVFDVDSGAGTQYALGVNLRKSASGGSVELGTGADPIRTDPTGTTTQPISAVALPLPTGAATEATLATRAAAAQLPAVLVGGRLDENIGAWLGSTAPTVGQKTMASSVPVVIASDQSAIPITGSITATNPSVGLNAAAAPTSSTQVGGSDGTNLQAGRVFDLDTGAGTEYDLGVSLRLPGSGGSVAGGTSADPLRIDPTGSTAQPVTDNAGSLTVDSPQLPAALVGARLDVNVGAWLGATTPTVGQKTMAASIPVVIASDQSAITANIGTTGGLALDATLTGGTQTTRITDGADTAAVIPASTAAAAADPALVVATRQPATGTTTSVASSASNVTLLAANTARLGATIYNDSTKVLYLKLGSTASTTSYTVQIGRDGFFEVPFGYTGIIDGLWASVGGAARVTELA